MTDTTNMANVGWGEIFNRSYAAPLLLVCLGVWLHAADSLIVATMMPAIVSEIGGEAFVAWTVALYQIGSIIAGAVSALLVLRRGVRHPMMLSATIFAAGCLISAIAPSMSLLLIGRLLQGIGGGGLTAVSFIATATLFPARLTARVMAAISVLWGASAFLGPLIGGLFTEYSTWRMGFVFFAAQALFLAGWIMFGIRIIERSQSVDAPTAIPLGRLTLLSFGVIAIAWAGIDVTLPRTPMLLFVGMAIMMVFLRIDAANAETRLLPRNPFNLRTPVGAALVMTLAMNVAAMGLATYGPLLMTIIHGTPAIVAGYVLASTAIGWTIAAIVVSGAPPRHDPVYIAAGMSMVFFSVVAMIYAVPHGPIPLIAALAALEGVGFGTAWTFVIRRTRLLADADDVERLSGALPTVGRFGYALGASVSGILANAAGFAINNTPEIAAAVARTIFTGSLPFAFLGLLAMVFFVAMKQED